MSSVTSSVLVTGALGQLGAAFLAQLPPGRVVGVDIDTLDITREADVAAFVRDMRPSLIINCAAFNDVDGAELSPGRAALVNTEAVWTLAHAAREVGATLVHYSTDFVFDGASDTPYVEEDTPAPKSVYGTSKWLGEQAAASVEHHYVLRLSSLYGGHTRKAGVDWILQKAGDDQPVRAFFDRTVSPSYVPDVVRMTLALVERGAPCGLYHCGSTGWCTWSELAAHILQRVGRPDLLQPIPFANSAPGATRPRHCALANQRLEREGLQPLHWRTALDDYLTRRVSAPISASAARPPEGR
jgi:dTDP-4-dehydrorhamnose reductase